MIAQPTTTTSHEFYDHTYSREAITTAYSNYALATFTVAPACCFYNRHVHCRE